MADDSRKRDASSSTVAALGGMLNAMAMSNPSRREMVAVRVANMMVWRKERAKVSAMRVGMAIMAETSKMPTARMVTVMTHATSMA